jgi:uncharacterized coiled-coil protein SlyX
VADKLSDLIDDMVREKTFSLDALDAVKGLRDRALVQDASIEKLTKTLADRDETIGKMRSQASELSAEITAFKARESSIAEREGKTRDLELREAASTASAGAYREVFGTIFKNVTVRESAMKQLPYSNTQPGGQTFTGFQASSESVERTTE